MALNVGVTVGGGAGGAKTFVSISMMPIGPVDKLAMEPREPFILSFKVPVLRTMLLSISVTFPVIEASTLIDPGLK